MLRETRNEAVSYQLSLWHQCTLIVYQRVVTIEADGTEDDPPWHAVRKIDLGWNIFKGNKYGRRPSDFKVINFDPSSLPKE